MPEELTPVIREEEYLAAIAGQDATPPDPATRKEEWLDAIAGRVDGLAEDVGDLGNIVPAPAPADSGKVLTAGADGTASWQTASGGGGEGPLVLKCTGAATISENNEMVVHADATYAEVLACFSATSPRPVFILVPSIDLLASPYYDYSTPGSNSMAAVQYLLDPVSVRQEWNIYIYDDDGATQLSFEYSGH